MAKNRSDAVGEQQRRHQLTQGRVFVSEVFRNEEIVPEQMKEDVHHVFFCNTELGEFNSSDMRFRPVLRT
jgi:hypothetical protein